MEIVDRKALIHFCIENPLKFFENAALSESSRAALGSIDTDCKPSGSQSIHVHVRNLYLQLYPIMYPIAGMNLLSSDFFFTIIVY